jgi:hypothetical protein
MQLSSLTKGWILYLIFALTYKTITKLISNVKKDLNPRKNHENMTVLFMLVDCQCRQVFHMVFDIEKRPPDFVRVTFDFRCTVSNEQDLI